MQQGTITGARAPHGASPKEARKRLIFVMGVQRSGTNALRQSLSLSPGVVGYNESEESEFFKDWFLRPEPELRARLAAVPGIVLLKPISETLRRSVSSLFDEFAGYDLSVVWIYRDPVAVHRSTRAHPVLGKRFADGGSDGVARFVDEWCTRNRSALDAAASRGPRVSIVSHRDLCHDHLVFRSLCAHLGLAVADNLFRRDARGTTEAEPGDVADAIRRDTAEVWHALEEARSFRARGRTLRPDPAPPPNPLQSRVDELETRLSEAERSTRSMRRRADALRSRLDRIEGSWAWRLAERATRGARSARRLIRAAFGRPDDED